MARKAARPRGDVELGSRKLKWGPHAATPPLGTPGSPQPFCMSQQAGWGPHAARLSDPTSKPPVMGLSCDPGPGDKWGPRCRRCLHLRLHQDKACTCPGVWPQNKGGSCTSSVMGGVQQGAARTTLLCSTHPGGPWWKGLCPSVLPDSCRIWQAYGELTAIPPIWLTQKGLSQGDRS